MSLSAPPPAAPLRGGGGGLPNQSTKPVSGRLPRTCPSKMLLTEASLGRQRGYRKSVPQVTGVPAQVLLGNSYKSELHRREARRGNFDDEPRRKTKSVKIDGDPMM